MEVLQGHRQRIETAIVGIHYDSLREAIETIAQDNNGSFFTDTVENEFVCSQG